MSRLPEYLTSAPADIRAAINAIEFFRETLVTGKRVRVKPDEGQTVEELARADIERVIRLEKLAALLETRT